MTRSSAALRRVLPVVLLLALPALLVGCKAVAEQKIIRHAVWGGQSKDAVFGATIKALHTQEYMILDAKPETGLIITDYSTFQGPGEIVPAFRLNVFVFDSTPGTVTVSIKMAVKVNLPPTPSQKRTINGKIGERVKGLYVEMARLLGEPISVGHGMLSW